MYILLCTFYYVRPIISIPFSKFMVTGSGSKSACMRLRESNKWRTVRIIIFIYLLTNLAMFHEVLFFFKWTNVDSFLRILHLCFDTKAAATTNAIQHDFMKKGISHFTLCSMERLNILSHQSILHHDLERHTAQVAFV